MFWSDRIAQEIIGSKKFIPYWVDDMFTPSGYAHIGSLRGPLVHDLVYRSLIDAHADATSTYIFNDFDPIDGLPEELREGSSQYLGMPLRLAPSPFPEYSSFAEYFTTDMQKVLRSLGVRATFLSSWDMYREGKFNDVIRIALDHTDAILDIYKRVSGSQKREKGWLPLQVVCEKCGKLGTTRVHDWDGMTVGYTCEPSMVTWAVGCGYTGRISPFDGHGKLPWKVDWPAHWSVVGVTIEGAGKDHSTAGGSRDMAREQCREVFHIDEPFNLPYEFFLIGGKKMSSSKGLGLKARNLTDLFPVEIARFLFIRTDYKQAIEFDPVGTMAIPDLFDEYDRCYAAYVTGSDVNFSRAFELSQITAVPDKTNVFLPRFRDVANYVQLPFVDLPKKFAEKKGSPLNALELHILEERAKYAKIWLTTYAPEEYRMQMTGEVPDEVSNLTDIQKKYLTEIVPLIQTIDEPDALQMALYTKAKDMKIPTKDAFAALYTAIVGKTHGPKAAWLIIQYPKDRIITRLTESGSNSQSGQKVSRIEKFEKPEVFTIRGDVKEKFPSISIGIAYVSNVHVQKTDEKLEMEKKNLLETLSGLTNETISAFPEIVSYRKLYREMGVDWHSRRPSPEALLRRISHGKGLYTVNTCVDAYNLAVIKNKVSVGAFDADMLKFPTILRFADAGDTILLHGDEVPTAYTQKELAYYDGIGGYNLDFNYRDAKRTLVTEQTKNIIINVDGVYDVTPDHVAKTLRDAVDIITRYCGGTVEYEGVII